MTGFFVISQSRELDGVMFTIKSEIGLESNIFEDSTDTRAIQDQLWFGITHDHRSNRQQLHLKMMSNLSLYNDYHEENKSLNMLFLKHNYLLDRWFSIATNLEIFNKQWHRQNYGYTCSLVSTSFNYTATDFQVLTGIEYKFNHFPSLLLFNSDNTGLFLQICKTASEGGLLTMKVAHHSIRYSDRIIMNTDIPDTIGRPLQKDQLLYFQLGSELRKRNVFGLYFRFMNNRSNNDYASFQSVAIRLFTSQKIWGFYTQLIIELQIKKYSDTQTQPLVIINADPEQNIQNQIMFGWDKPLSEHLSIQGKIAYIKNETVYSSLYYDKWFTSIGLMYRF